MIASPLPSPSAESATRQRVVPAALAAVQQPVRERLTDVRRFMEEAVTRDVPLLAQSARHLLAMKGKLFRPTLVLLASEVDGHPSERAVVTAAVVEMVHLATLIHDDSVDHSLLRRGMPTLNALFGDQVSVIMGDFLYSTALTHLIAMDDMRAIRALVDASTQMTVGELRQLSNTSPLDFSEAEYEFLIRSKTASLISAACRVGALCGSERYVEVLAQYGDALGMAFQITDDLIDYTEATETTGKPSGNDLREHKTTLPLIAALRSMSPAARARVQALFDSDDPGPDCLGEVASLVIDAGGLEYARRRGQEWALRAADLLEQLPPSDARNALSAGISYVMERHA